MDNPIKALRVAKGLTQTQLADDLGVRQSTISKWEKDHLSIDKENMQNICEYFGITEELILESAYTNTVMFRYIEQHAKTKDSMGLPLSISHIKGMIQAGFPQNYCKAVVSYFADDMLKFIVDIWPTLDVKEAVEIFGFVQGVIGAERSRDWVPSHGLSFNWRNEMSPKDERDEEIINDEN